MKGLGSSYNSEYYGIRGIDEVRAYLDHPILGKRLIECCEILLSLDVSDISKVMGYPDDLKLKSCMELFSRVTDYPFCDVLEKFY
ncbi:MAG: DUF1810 family protein [Spirochaetales bacterium]|nr:DUF1810 family protein [Spirochaetales bacterium]